MRAPRTAGVGAGGLSMTRTADVAPGGRKNGDAALVVALAGGATVQEAARAAGVSERTVYRRLEDGTFRHAVAEARSGLIGRAAGVLARVCAAAAMTLADLLEAESETVRLGACRSILELGVKLRESEELERRLAELERALGTQGTQGTRRVR
jgi:hypothetical protein